jgi:hypothetical protein
MLSSGNKIWFYTKPSRRYGLVVLTSQKVATTVLVSVASGFCYDPPLIRRARTLGILRSIEPGPMSKSRLTSLTTPLIVSLMFFFLLGCAVLAQQQNSSSEPVSHRQRAIVIGFMGGNVAPDDIIRNELIMSDRLRASYPQGVYFEVFENRRVEAAHQKILQLLGTTPGHSSSPAGKSAGQIILYGHSWGASAVVTLADELHKDGVPVTLTVQVDSIEKKGQQDGVIPANVARAVNFYQPDGFLHGRTEIRAADPAATQILGNFRVSYKDKEIPPECSAYPWYERKFIKTHIAIECDPTLWNRIEGLIRDSLGQPSSETASSR